MLTTGNKKVSPAAISQARYALLARGEYIKERLEVAEHAGAAGQVHAQFWTEEKTRVDAALIEFNRAVAA
jgi:hypothetical protein